MSVEREQYPGYLRREIVKTVIELRGATMLKIIEALAEKEFFPTEALLNVNLCTLAKEGYLVRSEVKEKCACCGAKKYVWKPTDDGRVYAEGFWGEIRRARLVSGGAA